MTATITTGEAEWIIGEVMRHYQRQPTETGGTRVPPRWAFRTVEGSRWRLVVPESTTTQHLASRLHGLRARLEIGSPGDDEGPPDDVVVIVQGADVDASVERACRRADVIAYVGDATGCASIEGIARDGAVIILVNDGSDEKA